MDPELAGDTLGAPSRQMGGALQTHGFHLPRDTWWLSSVHRERQQHRFKIKHEFTYLHVSKGTVCLWQRKACEAEEF